ncbi:MAG TPA: hypothetical protein VGK19_11195, partial [Capsulimonadaceae bacterium]
MFVFPVSAQRFCVLQSATRFQILRNEKVHASYLRKTKIKYDKCLQMSAQNRNYSGMAWLCAVVASCLWFSTLGLAVVHSLRLSGLQGDCGLACAWLR